MDVLEALWVLASATGILRHANWRWPGGRGAITDRAHNALDRIKHALAVDGPQLTVLALREQLNEVALVASDFAHGNWATGHIDDDGNPVPNEVRLNGGQVDLESYVAWVTKVFEAYVDGSWTTFVVEPRPVLTRADVGTWMPPDARD